MWKNKCNFSHLKIYKWSFFLLSDFKWFSKFIFFWWEEPNKYVMLLYSEGYIFFLLLFFFGPLFIIKKNYQQNIDFIVTSIFNWHIAILFYASFLRKKKMNILFFEIKEKFEIFLPTNFIYSFYHINYFFFEIFNHLAFVLSILDDQKIVLFKWILKKKFDDFREFDDFLVDNDLNAWRLKLLLKEINSFEQFSSGELLILQDELEKENLMVTLHEDLSDIIELEKESSEEEDMEEKIELDLTIEENDLLTTYVCLYIFFFSKKLLWITYKNITYFLKKYVIFSFNNMLKNYLVIFNKCYRYIKDLFRISKSYLLYLIDVVPTDKITETNMFLGQWFDELLKDVFYPTIYFWLFNHKPFWNFWIFQRWSLMFYKFLKYLIKFEKIWTIVFGLQNIIFKNYFKIHVNEWFFLMSRLNPYLVLLFFWKTNNFFYSKMFSKNVNFTKKNFNISYIPTILINLNNLFFINIFDNFIDLGRENYFYKKNNFNDYNIYLYKIKLLFLVKKLFFLLKNSISIRLYYYFSKFIVFSIFANKEFANNVSLDEMIECIQFELLLDFSFFLNFYKFFLKNKQFLNMEKSELLLMNKLTNNKMINLFIILLLVNKIFKKFSWFIFFKNKIINFSYNLKQNFFYKFFNKSLTFIHEKWLKYIITKYNIKDTFFSWFYEEVNNNYLTVIEYLELDIDLFEIFDLFDLSDLFIEQNNYFLLNNTLKNNLIFVKKLNYFNFDWINSIKIKNNKFFRQLNVFQFIFLKLFLLHWPYWFYLYFDWLWIIRDIQLFSNLRVMYHLILLMRNLWKNFFFDQKKINFNYFFQFFLFLDTFEFYSERFKNYEIFFFNSTEDDTVALEFFEEYYLQINLKKYFFSSNSIKFLYNFFFFEYFFGPYNFDLNIFIYLNKESELDFYFTLPKIFEEEIMLCYHYYIFKYFNLQITQFELDLAFKKKNYLLSCSKDNFFFKLFFLNYFLFIWFYWNYN